MALLQSIQRLVCMRSMISPHFIVGASVLLTFLPAGLCAAAEPPADLLKKLAEHDARIDRIYKEGSFATEAKSEELKGDGEVKHTLEIWMRVTQQGGKRVQLLAKALKDGKDVTEERRKKDDPLGESKRSEISPFAANVQQQYAFKVLGAEKSDASLMRIHFEPKGTYTEDLLIGEAVVDPRAGEVVRINSRPSDYPSNLDRVNTDIQFDQKTVSGRVLSRISMEGEGGFLFIKTRFRNTITYSDYDLSAIKPPIVVNTGSH